MHANFENEIFKVSLSHWFFSLHKIVKNANKNSLNLFQMMDIILMFSFIKYLLGKKFDKIKTNVLF